MCMLAPAAPGWLGWVRLVAIAVVAPMSDLRMLITNSTEIQAPGSALIRRGDSGLYGTCDYGS